jgi:hypothetical protein
MSRRVFIRCIVVTAVSTLLMGGNAFGWGGPTHSALCKQVFDDPIVAPQVSRLSPSAISTIENWTGEPPDPWQDSQWGNVYNRSYIDGRPSPNDLDWQSLDQTTRLKYMMHNLADVAVPIGHSPACYNPNGYSNTVIEGILEAQVSTWGTYPDVEGTTTWHNDESGSTYYYTGTITEILNTHYDACRDNRDWYKSTEHWPGWHTTEENHDAGWNGTAIAQMLMRAMFMDYMLNMNPLTIYAPNASGTNSITFDQHNSYDPDCISWNSDATYDKLRGIQPQGIKYFWYDLDNDGVDDVQSWENTMTMSAETLINTYGAQRGQWNYYRVRGKDNENISTYVTGKFYLNPIAAPEPATMSLLAISGAITLLRGKR